MNTLQFQLVPDSEVPMFKRLQVDIVPVTLQEILEQGIHPLQPNVDSYLGAEVIIKIMNKVKNKPATLVEQGYCCDFDVQRNSYYGGMHGRTVFERTIKYIQDNVYFVDNLEYLQLLKVARQRLREEWNHLLVLEMLKSAYFQFQELRRFLKTKCSTLKLSGYEDLNQCNLKSIVSVDDFDAFDQLVIRYGVPKAPNFRKASCLEKITDGAGRLKLIDRIDDITLTQIPQDTVDMAVVAWHVSRDDAGWRFRPDVGKCPFKRKAAKLFAKQWREDDGDLCFTAGIDVLEKMVEQRFAAPSFPSLNYHHERHSPTASAIVQDCRITTYGIPAYPDHNWTGADLKELLKTNKVSMTGNKDALLSKLAKLVAMEYDKVLPELNAYFGKNRFIRMATGKSKFQQFPILETHLDIRNLLITLYVAKHMHGNAIVTADHENDTFTVEALAHALITGKTRVDGTFLPVV
nr:hypothetical protein 17 [Candidatus Hydrogenedentota bacterium]